MARIVSAAGATSVVHDGKEYRPNRQGVFSVPNQVAEELRAHGFEPLEKPKSTSSLKQSED
jgi:hypothetical protein